MTDTYRVIVVRERMVRRGILGGAPVELPAEVLFEAAGPDPSRLLGYAPDEVEQALKAASEAPAEPERAAPLVDVEALAAGGVLSSSAAPVAVGETPAADDKPKRTRRTRAEIAAAKAAEQAGAETPAAVTVPEPALVPQHAVAAVAEPAPAQQPAATPAAVPGVAYNPFA